MGLTLGLCEARECWQWYRGWGGDPEKRTCPDDNALCELRVEYGHIIEMDCSDYTWFPSSYSYVYWDPTHTATYKIFGKMENEFCKSDQNKFSKYDKKITCLCEGDLCNNTSNRSALASFTLLTSLLITKAIF